ncbi:hypothetical protein [Hydrogenovibrio marinus]|uniref:Uncharacterized protein n=1 Tax=Hydrogenovibrio marinus TaxID=28885 RepID=A0A066ZW50_HYDMR|nr:hypothetical protein [Hydrogenovibrio marinus]KDN96514.1 hypothetical protein EI16_09645 [Hydrogenovibrio marinus]BBN60284.1 hypothetical protein HVMH_1878 [Hydrogenovibrio marinus]
MGDRHFDLKSLAKKINSNLNGVNYFVCVSPLNGEKLEKFQDLIGGDGIISVDDSDIGRWSRIHRVFKKVA